MIGVYSDGYSEIHWKISRKIVYERIISLSKSRIMDFTKCDALRDLVPFGQFKKREKHPWTSVTFKALLHGCFCFSRFLNCTDGSKSRKASQIHF